MRFSYTFRCSILISLFFVSLSSSRLVGAEMPQSTRVRALIYIDPLSGLPGLDQNRNRIRGLLDWLYTQDQSKVKIDQYIGPETYERISPTRILSDIQNLTDVRGDETIFLYYSGHGATDRSKGHWLQTTGGAITRDDLRNALKAKGARSVILLTDCCSSVADLPVEFAFAAPLTTLRPTEMTKIMTDLFLRSSGIVDITAATYDKTTGIGEYAWYTAGAGGIFTEAIWNVTALGNGYDSLDLNRDSFVSWKELHAKLDSSMNESYKRMRDDFMMRYGNPAILSREYQDLYFKLSNQPRQTPQAFSFGTTDAPHAFRPEASPTVGALENLGTASAR